MPISGLFQQPNGKLRRVGFDRYTKREIRAVIRKLNKLPEELRPKVRRKILRKAAKPLLASAKRKAPRSKQIHFRYRNGQVVAAYYPGNLAASIRILQLRKTTDVYVGPFVRKRKPTGDFGPSGKVDGFYAAFVEFGTCKQRYQPFMRPAFYETKARMKKVIIDGVEKIVKKFAKKNAV